MSLVAIKRVSGIYTLNENLMYNIDSTLTSTITFYTALPNGVLNKNDSVATIYAEALPLIIGGVNDTPCMWFNSNESCAVVFIRVLKSSLSAETVDAFKTYLKSNPIPIVYQLEKQSIIPYADFEQYGITLEGSLASNLGYTVVGVDSTGNYPDVEIKFPTTISGAIEGIRKDLAQTEAVVSDHEVRLDLLTEQNTLSVKTNISCGIPQSATIANATSVIPKFDLYPRHIINPFGRIGGMYKDSNSDGLADGWTGSSAGTFSLSNGEQTFTPTAQWGNINKQSTIAAGRLIFICSTIKTTDNTARPLTDGGTETYKAHTGSGTFEKCATLRAVNANTVLEAALSSKTTGFVPITVKQAFYVDVTDYPELVGLTNQQKLDWCLANLEYVDGIGVTKNPTFKVTQPNGNITYTTVQGDFLTGDLPTIVDGKSYGSKMWSSNKVMYGKDYNWNYNGDGTGFKYIRVKNESDAKTGVVGNLMMNYDSSVLVESSGISNSSEFIVNADGYTYVLPADTLTGWTETLAPNDDEVKAYMNGWKATANNGTRYTAWVSVVDGTTAPTTQSIDFVKANVAPLYEGYKLYYKYTNVKQITDESRSYLAPMVGDEIALLSGTNTVTLSNGNVFNETIVPVYDGVIYSWINNLSYPLSWTINKNSAIVSIMKNGTVDSSWTIDSNGTPYGKQRAYMSGQFDTNAVYSINYVIFNSAQIGSAQMTTAEGLVTTVNSLIGEVDGKQDKHVALDSIINASTYEKFSAYVVSRAISIYQNNLGVSASVKLKEKICVPTIRVELLTVQYYDSTGFGTNIPFADCSVQFSQTDKENILIFFIYKGSDSAIKTALKDNGMLVKYSLIADCRGRV